MCVEKVWGMAGGEGGGLSFLLGKLRVCVVTSLFWGWEMVRFGWVWEGLVIAVLIEKYKS